MGSPQGTEEVRPRYKEWLRGPLVLIAVVIVTRFILEAAGVPKAGTRLVSASVGGVLIVIYLGAVAPLRGITRFRQLALPALVASAWMGGWTALSLAVSGAFQLSGSHFSDAPGSFHNWQHLGLHVFSHIALSVIA